jgi:crossover junction endodeoxyribonuclease RusA
VTTFDLPYPPSVNSIWRSGRGRVYRSSRYQAWRKSAGWELTLQRPPCLTGWVSVSISAGAPDRRKRDIDNVGKATLDLLTAHQVIEDDSKVLELSGRWDDTVPPGRLWVEIEPRAIKHRRRRCLRRVRKVKPA